METYYEQQNYIKPKDIDDIDFNLLSVASMNDYTVASKEKPIIGTYALATCLGIIFYDKAGNYLLGHILNDYEKLLKEMINKLKNTGPIKVIIIPGYYTTFRKIEEVINHLHSKDNFFYFDFEIEIKNLKEYINKELTSVEFAFDTRTKEFVRPDYDKYINNKEDKTWTI